MIKKENTFKLVLSTELITLALELRRMSDKMLELSSDTLKKSDEELSSLDGFKKHIEDVYKILDDGGSLKSKYLSSLDKMLK